MTFSRSHPCWICTRWALPCFARTGPCPDCFTGSRINRFLVVAGQIIRRPAVLGAMMALVLPTVHLQAQVPLTAHAVVDSLAAMRDRAEPLWRDNAPAGRALLDSARAFLAQEHVADLVRGSFALQTRVFNFAMEDACAQAIAGNRALALDRFEAMYHAGAPANFSSYVERGCPALFEMRDEPRYRRILALWRSESRRWRSTALRSPYSDTLPLDRRIAGLSLLWSNVKMVLPGFETTPGLDLDSLYLAYLPRVRREQSTLDYYMMLTRFVAELRDAHTNLFLPDSVRQRRYAGPPLRTLPVDGKAVVRWVLARELDEAGLAPGQIIEAIDGVPTDDYVAGHILPWVSASTPQDRALRTFGYELLTGDANTPVRLTVRRPDSSVFEVDVPRSGYADERPFRRNTDSLLDGNIGYLRLDDFGVPNAALYVEEAMGRLIETRALIVDVRLNGGGSSWPGYRLLMTLADTAFSSNPSFVRMHDPNARRGGLEPLLMRLADSRFEVDDSLHYERPVIVLTSAMTFSAAEDFVASFKAQGRGVIIGEATGGSTGQPFAFALPGGGAAQVRMKHDLLPGGGEFIGVGIIPDIVVHPTIADIASGADPVLDRAISELRTARRGRPD